MLALDFANSKMRLRPSTHQKLSDVILALFSPSEPAGNMPNKTKGMEYLEAQRAKKIRYMTDRGIYALTNPSFKRTHPNDTDVKATIDRVRAEERVKAESRPTISELELESLR